MLARLTSADFSPLLQQAFRLRCTPDPLTLELCLIQVTELGEAASPPESRRRPFSLLFRGALTPVLPQHIYSLEHEALGMLDIFLVPIGPDSAGMRYEAIFT